MVVSSRIVAVVDLSEGRYILDLYDLYDLAYVTG